MSLVTFKADFSVPPKKRSEAQLHYCFDDTVELSDDDKQRIDDRAKELDVKTPYVDGAKDLRKNYISPRPDSPSFSSAKTAAKA